MHIDETVAPNMPMLSPKPFLDLQTKLRSNIYRLVPIVDVSLVYINYNKDGPSAKARPWMPARSSRKRKRPWDACTTMPMSTPSISAITSLIQLLKSVLVVTSRLASSLIF